MKLIIAGSRNFNSLEHYKLLEKEVFKIYNISEIISGGAKGADYLGEKFANKYNIKVTRYIPDWNIGRYAGMKRNETMAKEGDYLIAFWDGKSKGTEHMIKYFSKLNKKYKIVKYNDVLNMF